MRHAFKNVTFIKSAVGLDDCPMLRGGGMLLPEIAIVGRSNVGKSSLLNHLLQRKGLARTSSIPGKTQLLNFFNVDDRWVFADLPGYGFAKAPLQVRKSFGPMMESYLTGREQLKLLLFLLDIRRDPSEEDLLLMRFAQHYKTPLLLVLTKVDKVGKQEKIQRTHAILNALQATTVPYIHTSSTTGIGRKELLHHIQDRIGS